MIPLKNLNPRMTFPVVTLGIIAANVVVFFHQRSLGPHAATQLIEAYGMVPARVQQALSGSDVTLSQAFLPLFTSMFLHAGWLHIIGNMWFLWIFGDNVEDRIGHIPYLFFYMACGLGAGIAQTAFSWGSTIPSIGASGAISGVLGAYIVFFPTSRILTLIPLFIFWFTAKLPAIIFIGIWFLLQFLSGLGALAAQSSGGVAWWAHVGGFVLGMLLVLGQRNRRATPLYYG